MAQIVLHPVRYIPEIVFGVLVLTCALTGTIPLRGREIERSNQPILFWSVLFFAVLLVAVVEFLLP